MPMLVNPREFIPDCAISEIPLVETIPILDIWIDGIAGTEIVGRGHCFRTTMFALTKLDGIWVRAVVIKSVRAIDAYKRNQLGDMLASAQAAVSSGLMLQ